MASGFNIEINRLREWAPLTDLFSKLPLRSQNGIFAQDVKLTCLDVLPEFLVLGTNLGIIYWYDRKKKDLQRLRCEKPNVPITAIKLISTVDYMVACGNKDGVINIFQIPKAHPDSIPENLRPKNKQAERYIVADLHKSPVTTIEWAKNGMKLFSGDKRGCIVLTEIDFYMHICKSVEILNEAYEVIQLSYCQQRLLVSTTYRSIICQRQDKWKVCQVGKKDRKILGRFGGVICQSGPKASDSILYCTRPGLRIWEADCDGNVGRTLLFKDLLCKECPEVPIINPISRNLRHLKPQKEPSFGIVLSFNDELIITYNADVIYILDPKKMSVISTMSHFRSVMCVATYKDEIFVLEEERSIVRISYKPEPAYDLGAYAASGTPFLPLSTSIKDLTNKLQSSHIMPAISQFNDNNTDVNIHTDHSLIMNAEEAKELPQQSNHCLLNTELEKKFDNIGKQQFNEKILFKENRKKKNQMCASTCSLSSNSSEEKEANYIKATLMTISSVGILPDLRSPESIQNDIEYKEKILADVLNLDRIKIPLEKLQVTEQSPNDCLVNGEEEINNDIKIWENSVGSPENYLLKSRESPTVKNEILQAEEPKIVQVTAPACINVPNDWNLADIHLTTGKTDNSLSDCSLTDWEIV